MPLLQVEDLTKSFNGSLGLFSSGYFHAVEQISFSLEAGNTLAIIGRNGSGKSTLAKMIVGITKPTSGNILFKDNPLVFGDYHYRAKHIRMVFQDPNTAFNPRLNVGQVLDAPLLLTTKFDEQQRNQKIFDILKLVGMHPDHTNIKINTLSVSQKQRIALARALILNPEVVIIDDALGSLDATVKTQLTNLVLELQKKLKLAYIYVGQNLGIIKHIADTILVMEDGKMIEYGDTHSLFTAPKTDVTKRLIESHFGKILDNSSWKNEDLANKVR
ncbi:peptide ABC transporter ATP-binding protein [Aggregatibacter actinomycetemcomitans]|uniref:peptide ABC transporter ATP-binding protein n=1 Tax=Aggregatibacter actinomycetemcomitans TaxID=714 RepID=UPI0002AB9C7C|nr:ABC transporter ATP-binding protein [Aggregatibacter actinomycetemcomitans]KOE58515.1 peptide ABC transporter ATP-binding protein [Aggregatibacter actinomycetemcomitans serotype c str. AAS4A]KOE58585.1 peptide ABC transporter ATP-binding protein [Aggregatibacter actinomycetemcomitans serotype c str. SCC2302]TYA30496.1 ABC transporter ATP-binding protein [Aggregatibacter actinomycetemcomitans]